MGAAAPPAAPTVSGTPVCAFTAFIIEFSENVDFLNEGGWTIRVNGGAPSELTYAAGNGTSTGHFTYVTMIFGGDTVTYSYDAGTGNVENAAHVPLASITDQPVVNAN